VDVNSAHREQYTYSASADSFHLQTFLNFNTTASSNSQSIQQELPSIFSTSDARTVEALTVTGTLFTALVLTACCVSRIAIHRKQHDPRLGVDLGELASLAPC
jgi:hypothetical protein